MGVTDANVIVGKAILKIDGKDVGHTAEPVNVRLERDYLDVDSQRRKGVVKKVKTYERFFVTTAVEEATLELLKNAWDLDSAFGTVTLGSFYIGSSASNEHTLTLEGENPAGSTRTFTIYRAVSIEPGEYNMNREETTVIPIEFECLKDTNYLDASGDPLFGQIIDA